MPKNMIVRLGVDASDFQKKMKQAGVLSSATGAKIKNALTANGLSGVREIVAEMESARETILSSTAGMDISQPLSEQIKQVMADRDKILAEQSKVSKRLAEVQAMPVANTELSIARKQAKIRLLKEEVSGLRAAYASVSDQLSSLQSVASSIGPEFMRFASHTGLQQMDIEINYLKQALEDVSSIGDEAQKSESFISRAAKALRSMGSSGKQTNLIPGFLRRIGDSAGSSNGRLERMVRTIRNVSVVSFGLRIVRGMFGELGTVVRNYISQDAQLQAQVNGLSASMGNVLAPAIRLVSGALSYVLPYVVGVSNAIGQLMGALFGTGWSAGTSGANKMAAATGGAAKAQKELNRQLMSFDQINKVEGQKDTGAGGGGGAGSALEEIVGKTPAWMERFKASFTELFNSSEFQAANIGGKLGMVLQTGLDWLGDEGVYFDWRGVGTKLRENWDSFIEAGWAESLFRGLGVGMGGFAEAIIGFLEPEWEELQQHYEEKGALGAAEYIFGFVLGIPKALTEGIFTNIFDPFFAGIGEVMRESGHDSVANFFDGLATGSDSYGGLVKRTIVSNITNKIQEALGFGLPVSLSFSTGKSVSEEIASGMESGSGAVSEKLNNLEHDVTKTSDALRNAFSFEWRLPHLRLPHLSVQWDPVDNVLAQFFGVTAFPRLSVQWFAKGGILDGAQIFGRMGSTLLGGGERGREAILPLDTNTGWMDVLANRISQSLSTDGGDVNATINIVLDGEKIASYFIKRLRQSSRAGTSSF